MAWYSFTLKATPAAKKRKLICVVRHNSPKITTNDVKLMAVLPEFVFADVSVSIFVHVFHHHLYSRSQRVSGVPKFLPNLLYKRFQLIFGYHSIAYNIKYTYIIGCTSPTQLLTPTSLHFICLERKQIILTIRCSNTH